MLYRKKLTDKEIEICNNFLKTGNKRKSFELAGMNINNLRSIENFFKRNGVKIYLELCSELSDSAMSQNEVITSISRIARRLETEDVIAYTGNVMQVRQSIREQIKALEMMCRILGIDKIKETNISTTIIDDIVNDYDVEDDTINFAGIEENENKP